MHKIKIRITEGGSTSRNNIIPSSKLFRKRVGHHSGMVGHHETERGVNMLRNLHLFSVWGGAVQWTPELVAVFGNDGYISKDDEETQSFRKVQKFRTEIKARNIKELAFGTDSDGYTWSIIVEYGDARFIHELRWASLEYNEEQRIKAITSLSSMNEPFYETSDIFKK